MYSRKWQNHTSGKYFLPIIEFISNIDTLIIVESKMNTNDKLYQVYASKWDALCQKLDKHNLCGYEYNPLLLSVDNPDDFDAADIKVMLFGQDMSDGDWYRYDRHTQPLDECMKAIRTFDNATGSIDLNGNRQRKGMGGGMNKFIDTLNTYFPDKKIRYIWNDVVKLGRNVRNGNQYSSLLAEIEREYFNVVKNEINAINPQVLVFFTGPNPFWESKLQQCLDINASCYQAVPNWNSSTHQLALLTLNKETLPSVQYAFRTYHPCAHESKIYVKHIDIYKAISNHIQGL